MKSNEIFWVSCKGDSLFEDEDFYSYKDAVQRAEELAKEWADEGYEVETGWASERNMWAAKVNRPGKSPVFIEVNDEQE